MLRRIRRMWRLSRKDPKALERLAGISDEELANIPEVGDGKAVFFGAGTEEEWKEEQKSRKGLNGIFGL